MWVCSICFCPTYGTPGFWVKLNNLIANVDVGGGLHCYTHADASLLFSELTVATIILMWEHNLINARPHRRHHERCVDRSTENIIDSPCHAPQRRFLIMPPTTTPSDNLTINFMFDMLKYDVQNLLETFVSIITIFISNSSSSFIIIFGNMRCYIVFLRSCSKS